MKQTTYGRDETQMNLHPSEIEVLQAIRQSDGISRKLLAEKTGFSQASITKLTKSLMDQGYIMEGEKIGNGLGRKEVLLYPHPDKFAFLGIDIGGYRVRFALSNNRLDIKHHAEFLISELLQANDLPAELLLRVEAFLQAAGTEAVDAIGIGVTGIVDKTQRKILNIPNARGWDDLPIADLFEGRFGCPVYLEESGRAMAYAEKVAGKAKNTDDFITVYIAYGIAAGIFINGRLMRGVNNAAGLLGHITVDEKAGRCSCGNYGCLENLVTYPMLASRFNSRSGSTVSFAEAYLMNDKDALDVCLEAGEAIGIAISNVINLFNPEIIYLGGPVFERFPIVFEEVRRTVLLRANRFATLGMQLETNSFGDRQGIVGALALASASFVS